MIMLKLIQNELIKIFKRRKTLVTTIVFILLVSLIGFGTYKESEYQKKWNTPEYRLQMEKENLKHVKENSKDPNSEQIIKDIEARIAEIEKEKSGEKKRDWKAELRQQNESLKQTLKDPLTPEKDKSNLELNIKENEYLLEHNIMPQHLNFEPTATKFILILFEVLGAMFLLIGIIIFGADMVSGEYTPPTMKFLLAQPVSRGKILFSKFIALLITCASVILSVEIISFLIMGLAFGFGDMNYPVTVGSKYAVDLAQASNMGQKALSLVNGTAHIIPMSQYLVRMFFIQCLYMVVGVAFTFLISTIIRSSMVSMALGTVIIIAATILEQIPYTRKYMIYAFTAYGKFSNILDGSIATMFNNPDITMPFIMAVLGVWALICYLIAHFFFTKRDILI